jgi:hypothetical protein
MPTFLVQITAKANLVVEATCYASAEEFALSECQVGCLSCKEVNSTRELRPEEIEQEITCSNMGTLLIAD